MTDDITHIAVIESIEGHRVTLLLQDDGDGACGGCRLADLCSKQKQEDKAAVRLTVNVADTAGLAPGDRVRASVAQRVRWRAMLLTLVIPLAIFVAAIPLSLLAGIPQWGAVLLALVLTAAYYLALTRFHTLNHTWCWTLLRL